MIDHKSADCWKLHPELRHKNGRFKPKMDTGGMGIETILVGYEEDSSPVTEEEKIMRKIHNDMNSVDSDMDWVSSCNHFGATDKPNRLSVIFARLGIWMMRKSTA